MLLYCLLACTFIYAMARLIKDRRAIPLVNKAKHLMLGIILTGFAYLLSYLVDTDGGKRRLMTGGFNHDINFVHFQLFDDGRFKLLNSGPFGGNFYRGNYTLYKDTLRIDHEGLRNLYPSLTFILKEKTGNKKHFDPVDSAKSMYSLDIYKDFRTNKTLK